MAQQITSTENLRYHMNLQNGGSRYIDIENPITDTAVISSNIANLNTKLAGPYKGILASEEYFNGDSGAKVTSVASAEIIKVQKITTTTTVYT